MACEEPDVTFIRFLGSVALTGVGVDVVAPHQDYVRSGLSSATSSASSALPTNASTAAVQFMDEISKLEIAVKRNTDAQADSSALRSAEQALTRARKANLRPAEIRAIEDRVSKIRRRVRSASYSRSFLAKQHKASDDLAAISHIRNVKTPTGAGPSAESAKTSRPKPHEPRMENDFDNRGVSGLPTTRAVVQAAHKEFGLASSRQEVHDAMIRATQRLKLIQSKAESASQRHSARSQIANVEKAARLRRAELTKASTPTDGESASPAPAEIVDLVEALQLDPTSLKPSTRYRFGKYSWDTDKNGNVSHVEGYLSNQPGSRHSRLQTKIGHRGDAHDDGGHLIASRFGGFGSGPNVIPQARGLNRAFGAWYKMETVWAEALDGGRRVYISIDLAGPSFRPDSIVVKFEIDGDSEFRDFLNEDIAC